MENEYQGEDCGTADWEVDVEACLDMSAHCMLGENGGTRTPTPGDVVGQRASEEWSDD